MHVYNLVVGLGETGRPLFNILKNTYPDTAGIDSNLSNINIEDVNSCTYLHICIPGSINKFKDIVKNYCDDFTPDAVIIHSTVPVGTCSSLDHPAVFHSPINGKHLRMEEDMLENPKFLSGHNLELGGKIREMFIKTGIPEIILFNDSRITELGKLMTTTLFGYLIAWEQEVKRICDLYNVPREDVRQLWTRFADCPDFRIDNKYPGIIGGHCVLPNIEILRDDYNSNLLEWIIKSNKQTGE